MNLISTKWSLSSKRLKWNFKKVSGVDTKIVCFKDQISYDKLLLSSTNMENPGIGLDTQSGKIACLNHVTILVK